MIGKIEAIQGMNIPQTEWTVYENFKGVYGWRKDWGHEDKYTKCARVARILRERLS